MAGTFHCTVVTPEREVLDRELSYASIPAWDGQVGIEHLRAPLLVQLGEGAMRLDSPDGSSDTLLIAGGFAQMKDDRLTILTEQATPQSEISRDEAETALREALARPAVTEQDYERRERQTARARAMMRLAR